MFLCAISVLFAIRCPRVCWANFLSLNLVTWPFFVWDIQLKVKREKLTAETTLLDQGTFQSMLLVHWFNSSVSRMNWLMMILTFGFNPAVEPPPEFLPLICIIPQSQVSLFFILYLEQLPHVQFIPKDKASGSGNYTVYSTFSAPSNLTHDGSNGISFSRRWRLCVMIHLIGLL